MSSLLIDEHPLVVLPSLAKEIGLNEAVVLTYLKDVKCPVSSSDIFQSLGFLSLSTIGRILSNLKDLGLLHEENVSDPFEIKDLVITFNEDDKKMCEWCSGKSIVLHEHHFPIPKSDGGVNTVNICPNCHYGYHYLESRRFSVKGL